MLSFFPVILQKSNWDVSLTLHKAIKMNSTCHKLWMQWFLLIATAISMMPCTSKSGYDGYLMHSWKVIVIILWGSAATTYTNSKMQSWWNLMSHKSDCDTLLWIAAVIATRLQSLQKVTALLFCLLRIMKWDCNNLQAQEEWPQSTTVYCKCNCNATHKLAQKQCEEFCKIARARAMKFTNLQKWARQTAGSWMQLQRRGQFAKSNCNEKLWLANAIVMNYRNMQVSRVTATTLCELQKSDHGDTCKSQVHQ